MQMKDKFATHVENLEDALSYDPGMDKQWQEQFPAGPRTRSAFKATPASPEPSTSKAFTATPASPVQSISKAAQVSNN
jgi:hypothetical protein